MAAAYRIENRKLEKKFAACIKESGYGRKDIHFLYHGTRNQNVWNIIKEGLLLDPNAQITGKLFGKGLYFANKAKKSFNYSSLRGSYYSREGDDLGFCFIFKVAYKNPMNVAIWSPALTTLQ